MLPALSELVVDFEDDGGRGHVTVQLETNLDPSRWGYPFLRLPSAPGSARGFPVVRASVQTEAEGYGAIFAWVQVVTITDRFTGAVQRLVDVAPQLQGLGVPYLSYGVRPSLFDAPSTDAREDLDWAARSYLVASPDRVMTQHVLPLCGFTWGYRLRNGAVSLLTATRIGGERWSEDRSVLRESYASWTFGPWPG